MIDLFFLNKSDVVAIHDEIILNYGGSQGLRDQGLLESAIFQPQMMLFGEYVYIDRFEMAAAYAFHIIKNHPFVDGNKRTGILSAMTFLQLNGVLIDADYDLLYELAISIAHSSCTKDEIASLFRSWSVQ